MATFEGRVQYLDDSDPFSCTNYPEPARPKLHTFLLDVPLINQIQGVHRTLQAPILLENCALQLYRFNSGEGSFEAYLDLDSTLNEQWEEIEVIASERMSAIILRTKLTIRVLTCISRLTNSSGRELRRSLFSLKQIFQDDKDLVHEFVKQGGLECLVSISRTLDHNHQNYILRALGQVMLYVDGMQGIIARNGTVQWLYAMTGTKSRVVAKTAYKLLMVFLNYDGGGEPSQSQLILRAVNAVHQETGDKPWCYIIDTLNEKDEPDVELQKLAMTFMNQLLEAVPDQDTFYDITDSLEKLGMADVCYTHLSKQGADLDLSQKFFMYCLALKREDGEDVGSMAGKKLPKGESNKRKSQRSQDQAQLENGVTGTPEERRPSVEKKSEDRSTRASSTESSSSATTTSSSSSSSSSSSVSTDNSKESSPSQNGEMVSPQAADRRRERRNRQRTLIREQSRTKISVSEEVTETPIIVVDEPKTPEIIPRAIEVVPQVQNDGLNESTTNGPVSLVEEDYKPKPVTDRAAVVHEQHNKVDVVESSDASVEIEHVADSTPKSAKLESNNNDLAPIEYPGKKKASVDYVDQSVVKIALTPEAVNEHPPKEATPEFLGLAQTTLQQAELVKKLVQAEEPQTVAVPDIQASAESAAAATEAAGLQAEQKFEKIITEVVLIDSNSANISWDVLKDRIVKEKIALKIGEYDFSDLNSVEDLPEDPAPPAPGVPGGVPPPPPLLPGIPGAPPPPPPLLPAIPGAPPPPLFRVPGAPPPPPFSRGGVPPPPPFGRKGGKDQSDGGIRGLPPPPGTNVPKNKKTIRLHWKEINPYPTGVADADAKKNTIWSEVKAIPIDYQRLEHLFESRTGDVKIKEAKVTETKKEITVLNPKRSNAINIGMTVLPPPRTIKAAILKMDSSIITREGIEKILSMLPTEEEKNSILEAQVANPDTPLGQAEQFLFTLSSVTELEARLQLWAFKVDYPINELEIAEHLADLKSGIDNLKTNETFKYILAALLAMGNFLNGSFAHGFNIEYLSKVPDVRDTVHKHSLLHHLVTSVHEKYPESGDLYSDFGAITRCSRVDWDELAEKLKTMEEDCKKSFDRLQAISKYDTDTASWTKLSDFLVDCRSRIITMRLVHTRVLNRFKNLLVYFGIPKSKAKDMKVDQFCKSLSEFGLEYRTTREKIVTQIQKRQNNRERRKTRGKMIIESNDMSLMPNPAPNRRQSASSIASSAVSEDDAEQLQSLLQSDFSMRRGSPDGRLSPGRQRRTKPRLSVDNSQSMAYRRSSGGLSSAPDSEVADETDDGQSDLLEAFVKTASQPTNKRAKEKRRARNSERKSLRRTLRGGLKEEEASAIAELV